MTQTGMENGGSVASAARDELYRLGENDLVIVSYKKPGEHKPRFKTPEEAYRIEVAHLPSAQDEICVCRRTPDGGLAFCLKTLVCSRPFVVVEGPYAIRHPWAMIRTLIAMGVWETHAQEAVAHLWRGCEDLNGG